MSTQYIAHKNFLTLTLNITCRSVKRISPLLDEGLDVDMNVSDEIDPDPYKRPAGPSRRPEKRNLNEEEGLTCTQVGCPSIDRAFASTASYRRHLT